MIRENQNEIWQVEVGGQVYEAPLGELPEWIGEGSLQPDDKIRKGNLRWIEARKVPALIPFFNARAEGGPMPVFQSTTDASQEIIPNASAAVVAVPAEPASTPPPPAEFAQSPPRSRERSKRVAGNEAGRCGRHSDRDAFYVCSGCSIELCKACPTSYGGSVRICPECGAMCKSAAEAASAVLQGTAATAQNESFGFADLTRAFAHPFRFKPSLIFGGLMFMFFTLGKSASALGGTVFFIASLFSMLLANMLSFGVLSNTVDNFTKGKLDADFMPSFDDFSVWDDVVHPFLLSIGVYVSSFGAFFLVAVVGFYLIVSSVGEQAKKFNDHLSTVPGTQFYQPDRAVAQTQEVKDLLQKVTQQNDKRLADQQSATQPPAAAADDAADAAAAKEQAELERRLQENKFAVASDESTRKPAGYGDAISQILRLAAPLVVLGIITFLWGAFYFPAACAVAGYSRSFMATVNPLVGLDTIRRLGGDYVKLLLMGFLILVFSGVIGLLLSLLLSPLDLPKVGNVPAAAIGAIFSFYFWIVFCCTVGYALFKSGDRLKLYR